MNTYETINAQANAAIDELFYAADTLKKGDMLVIGCSTSEIMGKLIGTGSSVEAAKAVMDAVLPKVKEGDSILPCSAASTLTAALLLSASVWNAMACSRYG